MLRAYQIACVLQMACLGRTSWFSLPDGWFGKEILIFLTRWPVWLGNLDFPYQMAGLVRKSWFSLPDDPKPYEKGGVVSSYTRAGREIIEFIDFLIEKWWFWEGRAKPKIFRIPAWRRATVFHDIPRYSTIFLNIPWYFLDIPWYSMIFLDIPWYSSIFPRYSLIFQAVPGDFLIVALHVRQQRACARKWYILGVKTDVWEKQKRLA